MQRKLSSTGRMMAIEPALQGAPALRLAQGRDSGINRDLRAKSALRDFLDQVKDMQEDMRKETQRQMPYQVFFSYAWGNADDAVFKGLKNFLRNMHDDLIHAGTTVWFDEKRMTGNVEAQMHHGIAQSDLVLLFGTDVYRTKTQADSKTNVKKELNFALAESQQKIGLLKPLLFEGTFKETFSAPGLAGYTQIMVDATWVNLSQEDYDMQKYIKALTTYDQEVGIIPAALGLPDASQRYKSRYQTAEQLLQRQLHDIYSVSQAAPAQGVPQGEEKEFAFNHPNDSKASPEEITQLKADVEKLEKQQQDLLASTVYKKLPAVKDKEELDKRIQQFIGYKKQAEEMGDDFPAEKQAHLDICQDIAKKLPALDKQIQEIKEKIQLLEYGPASVVQGDIRHKGNIEANEAVVIGHDAKGKQGNVRQGDISLEGNIVSKTGGFRLGHSA